MRTVVFFKLLVAACLVGFVPARIQPHGARHLQPSCTSDADCRSDSCERCADSGRCEIFCDTNNCESCDSGSCRSTCNADNCEVCSGEGTCVSKCTGCNACSEVGICEPTCETCETCDETTNACVPTCPGQCQECRSSHHDFCVEIKTCPDCLTCGECEVCTPGGVCVPDTTCPCRPCGADEECVGGVCSLATEEEGCIPPCDGDRDCIEGICVPRDADGLPGCPPSATLGWDRVSNNWCALSPTASSLDTKQSSGP